MFKTLSLIVLCVVIAGLAGCANQRPELSAAEHEQRRQRFQAAVEIYRKRIFETILRRMEDEQMAFEAGEIQRPPIFDVLVISSGAEWGAFGAGFLNGWGEVPGEHELARPQFDLITGVSTGALISLYAITGSDERYREIEQFYRESDPAWVRRRGLIPFLPGNESFFDISGLEELIKAEVDIVLIREIAERSTESRILLVGTANLDLGRGEIWDLGYEARAAPDGTGSAERIQDILLAAIAVPGAFPPVEIDGELHVDGGTVQGIFVATDPDAIEKIADEWQVRRPGVPVPPIRFWVIVNNKVGGGLEPQTVQPRWSHIAKRSISTLTQSGLIAPLHGLWLLRELLSARADLDIEFRWVAIPNEHNVPDSDRFFDPVVTNDLADLGWKLGADPGVWQTLPPRFR